MISFARLLLTGALLFGIIALSAAQTRAAQTPTPDPYRSPGAAPSVPAPDPYQSPAKPKASPSTATSVPAPDPSPPSASPKPTGNSKLVATAPRTSGSEVADSRQTTPKAQKPKPSANQSGRNTTERVAAPRATREEKPEVAVAAAVAAVRDATSERALLLGGLALLTLVLASGSMLFLLIRSEGWEARP